MSFKVVSTGSFVPEKVVTNQMMSELVETSDEWIVQRTGIKERRVMTTETATDMAVAAAKKALENANFDPLELDLIVVSTLAGDYYSPSLACMVQAGVGAKCPAFDVNGACTGFIYALDVCQTYFMAGKVKNILVVSCETMSRMADWTDRATCVLFGDGAGAVLLTQGDSDKALHVTAQGNCDTMRIPSFKGNCPFTGAEQTPSYLYMNGGEVYKFAVSNSFRGIKGVMKELGWTPDDVTYFILHQANYRIIDAIREKLKQPEEKFPITIEKYGNISSACIPVVLDDLSQKGMLKRGDKLIFSAFGAGYTTGVVALEW